MGEKQKLFATTIVVFLGSICMKESAALTCHTCYHWEDRQNETCLSLKKKAGDNPSERSGESGSLFELLETETEAAASDGKQKARVCATFCGRYKSQTALVRTRARAKEGGCTSVQTSSFDGAWCLCDSDYCNTHKPETIQSCPFKTPGGGGGGGSRIHSMPFVIFSGFIIMMLASRE